MQVITLESMYSADLSISQDEILDKTIQDRLVKLTLYLVPFFWENEHICPSAHPAERQVTIMPALPTLNINLPLPQ